MKRLNKIKGKVLLFMLLVVAGMVNAQTHEFAPVVAEWYYQWLYREGDWNYTGVAYDRYRSLRTLEINGWVCKEIELYQHLDEYGSENPRTQYIYLTQEGERVYEVENGQRYLLYDFSKEVGESWYAPKYNVDVQVVGVSTMTLEDGSTRKVLETYIPVDDLYYYNIIEGIGLDKSLLPFGILYGPPQSIHDHIRCYSENGISLIFSETECDYEILSVDKQEEVPVVTMNTFVDAMLHIAFRDTCNELKQVRIMDVLGRTIFVTETTDDALDVTFVNNPHGLYLIQITINSQIIILK